MRVGGGDLGHRFGARGQQSGADVVDTGVTLEEPACHLRLTSETAEVDDGASMTQSFGADVGSDGCIVGSGNGAIGFGRWRRVRRQNCVGAESLGSPKSFIASRCIGRGFLVLVLGVRHRSVLRVRLARIDNSLGQRGRCITEPPDVKPRGDPNRLGDAVSKAEIQVVSQFEIGRG